MRNMKTTLVSFAACLAAILLIAAARADAPKPKRINRAIELLDQGQPVYYTGSHSGTEGSYEQGLKDAQTYADYISYDMEHAPFDVKGLAEYMRGLAAGGPTRSGHRTPAVIVNVPVNGTDEAAVRANAWMFSQVLATGVHGILLTHADTPGAVRAFVEAMRFSDSQTGRLERNQRRTPRAFMARRRRPRSGASRRRSISIKPTPGRSIPDGELLLGLKLEDKYALANAEENLKVPGIAFRRMGAGRHGAVAGRAWDGMSPRRDPRMVAARAKVFAACKANKIFFLNSMTARNVIDMIKEGVMIGPASPEAAALGRAYTKRQMPY